MRHIGTANHMESVMGEAKRRAILKRTPTDSSSVPSPTGGFQGFLIDPLAKSISPVRYNPQTDIGDLIDCGTVDALAVDHRHSLWVDDNGLYVPEEKKRYFTIQTKHGTT